MRPANTKLAVVVETYFADLARIHASGGATGERSRYGPLANLLNAVGATLKPKVFCVLELADQVLPDPLPRRAVCCLGGLLSIDVYSHPQK